MSLLKECVKLGENVMSNMKLNASKKALEYIDNGMNIVLGSGTTVHKFIELLSPKVKKGLKCKFASTSIDTTMMSRIHGIEITPFEILVEEKIQYAIDGADIISDNGIIKGGGGALTSEKIMGYAAEKMIILADENKYREVFGGIVPIEVIPVSYRSVLNKVNNGSIRMAEKKLGPVITDHGNFIIDVEMKEIKNPSEMESELNNIPGVVTNGIFTKYEHIIVGNENGARII